MPEPPVLLPVLQITPAAPAGGVAGRRDPARRARLIRWTKALSWASLVWMTAEGVIGLVAGRAANSSSLVAFGLSSVVEGMASVIVIWRFTGGRELTDHAERRAQRLVAISFWLLAPYIAYDAIATLAGGDDLHASPVGIALAVSSIIVMPVLGAAKTRLGTALGSPATRGEGLQNHLCAMTAAAMLVGLLADAAVGWWWLDPIVALGIAVVAVVEGRQSWRGDGCGCCDVSVPQAIAPRP